MIRFEHSVFALPFALGGAWLAAKGIPNLSDFFWIVLAAVFARNAAMAFNRIVDRKFDASNPRTAERELVTGTIRVSWTKMFVAVNVVLFVFASWMLAPICAWFSIPVLVILLGYSYLKRWTILCHFGLGLGLACSPAGAWLAISKDFLPGWALPLWIGGGVLAWVSGFDLLYSLQDMEHDRKEKLRSIPSLLGASRTRALSLVLHILAIFLWWTFGEKAGLGQFYWIGLALVAALLLCEHILIQVGGLTRIPLAFFQVNSWVGPIWFFGLALDLHQTAAILAG
ncbi:MAG TPA: UbiA-like polyprenyltransferase [Planctomycetota bacterium]|jgi:4-hydroxybenzoate polyprenyltransferase|nr:UbiA-like polyprenyltransferase [Planctomycetota bacterium]HJM40565.1 UbiA-like polyprenyltransferase [Planctomycetota bacterium]|tara:strand:- start:22883 stop:23734 length:852 start_codon:yes stop_codon:yes gene_type:complete